MLMKYMGSKTRHAKYILPIILKDRKPNQYYIEPFASGMNTICLVDGPRIANDNHYYLIELFKAIQKGWEPPDTVGEETYQDVRLNQKGYEPWFVGFVGFGCSYSGKWFGGYARGNTNNGEPRNYALESKRNLLKQRDGLRGVEFHNTNYYDFPLPNNSIIYCDPPYQGTTKYKCGINYDGFWAWCRELVNSGHGVFVSEYNAPLGWGCIWQRRVNNTLVQNTGSKQGVERLFIYRG